MVVGNMIRRVLKVIRDEEERTAGGASKGAVSDTGKWVSEIGMGVEEGSRCSLTLYERFYALERCTSLGVGLN